ncbi:hypothetical protein [Streptomyces spiramyceticus]|uniref:hypothetical protein n=1 Tax=Streptomyces spiramyceticus TaxID=299717 RepID=UPI00237A2133|nr:hypothetical protein [Streptomyces spiramyceticus]
MGVALQSFEGLIDPLVAVFGVGWCGGVAGVVTSWIFIGRDRTIRQLLGEWAEVGRGHPPGV